MKEVKVAIVAHVKEDGEVLFDACVDGQQHTVETAMECAEMWLDEAHGVPPTHRFYLSAQVDLDLYEPPTIQAALQGGNDE